MLFHCIGSSLTLIPDNVGRNKPRMLDKYVRQYSHFFDDDLVSNPTRLCMP